MTRRTAFEQHRFNTGKGPFHEERSDVRADPAPPVRLIAYYLPQFHAIDENDRWWGTGFTEWTNTTRTMPYFRGHYQPHLPSDLGFYDLSQPAVLRRQAALARESGIEGFCFHHYWFSGRPLLETPINNLLADPGIDLPFCINWANESWSRRWDGSEKDILIRQEYRAEDDLLFARSILPCLRDPRYLRVDGRPLVMVYRPSDFPDFARSVAVWRRFFAAEGVGDPFLVMPQAFGNDDPRPFGLDAAAGFPPHKTGWQLEDIGAGLRKYDGAYAGRIMDYAKLAESSLANMATDYTYFPGVCPSWDNHARKKSRGFVFHGSNPAVYGEWLYGAGRWLEREQPDRDKRIVFVNAWNEWAEGAHLEPDQFFGHAYLEETKRVLADLARPGGERLPRPWAQGAAVRGRRGGGARLLGPAGRLRRWVGRAKRPE